MIIDLILDRKCDEESIAKGFTHYKNFRTGEIVSLEYDPHEFYMAAMMYGEIADDITRAMDEGTEEDVKRALCDYVTKNEYNPSICDYINSREWLTA